MKQAKLGILVLGAFCFLAPDDTSATTRDIADLQLAPLTLGKSVIAELSVDVISDPYDEFLNRPFNLASVNIERLPNLSPWPGQAGEQDRYVDFLISNNGNSNVRNGADTLQGMYIAQGMDRFTWGVAAAYLVDDVGSSQAAGGDTFSDSQQIMGYDVRFASGYRVTNRIVMGGGITAFARGDETTDNTFQQGTGGFMSVQETTQDGVKVDFGLRIFTSERNSWEAQILVGEGTTEDDDVTQDLDAGGAVVNRAVLADFDISNSYIELSAGYNRQYREGDGEAQFKAGYRQATHELDNALLGFTDDGVTVTPTLTLLSQDAISQDTLFVSADTLFMRGWTQIFGGARLSMTETTGATQVDAQGNITDEIIDDSATQLTLVAGLRQPLWNERFRLVARARADWVDQSQETNFLVSATGSDVTRTTTSYAFGIEMVLNNVVFDLAWLFGGDPPPGGGTAATRQTIDLDRLVVSATFGW